MRFLGSKHSAAGRWYVPIVAVLLLFACDQEPIFDMISREVKPREPRVKGVPTKMVLFDTSLGTYGMYAADFSTLHPDPSLHRYAKNADGKAVWDEGNIPQPPGGRIFDLAATQSYLYALTDPESPKLYRFDRTEWKEVSFASDNQGYSRFQSIYGECNSDGKPQTDNLYVGASNSDGAYAAFFTNGGNLTQMPSTTGLLTGAAYDGTNYYFATDGGGVYTSTSPGTGFSPVTDAGGAVKGLIQLPSSSVIAIRGDGVLLTLSSSSATVHQAAEGAPNLTGAAAVWTNGSDNILLLAVQIPLSSSNSTYGYRELVLSSGSLPATIELKEPGTGTPSTADDNKRYRDTLEPKPVNSLLQVPSDIDNDMILFASVQGRGVSTNNTDGGLWSLRIRDGVLQWNAED
jgi:hypothetical protein